MARFATLPTLSWVGGDYPWRLDDDLIYISDIIGLVRVPRGYCTDFASVPRLPFVYWLAGGRAPLPSIVHDFLYDCWTQKITRRQADAVFLEAMHARPDPKRRALRYLMYVGPRLGGGTAWRRDSRHKCVG